MDYLVNSVEAFGGYRQSIILVDVRGSFVANFNAQRQIMKAMKLTAGEKMSLEKRVFCVCP